MNQERVNLKTQSHFTPVKRLHKPIDSMLKNKTTTNGTSNTETLKKIIVYSDGSHSARLSEGKPEKTKSAVLIYQNGVCIERLSKIHGPGWSDVAEYWGIYDGLERLLELELENEHIVWYGDSQFVMGYLTRNIPGKWKKEYYPISVRCIELLKKFKDISFCWIPRDQNQLADELSKL